MSPTSFSCTSRKSENFCPGAPGASASVSTIFRSVSPDLRRMASSRVRPSYRPALNPMSPELFIGTSPRLHNILPGASGAGWPARAIAESLPSDTLKMPWTAFPPTSPAWNAMSPRLFTAAYESDANRASPVPGAIWPVKTTGQVSQKVSRRQSPTITRHSTAARTSLPLKSFHFMKVTDVVVLLVRDSTSLPRECRRTTRGNTNSGRPRGVWTESLGRNCAWDDRVVHKCRKNRLPQPYGSGLRPGLSYWTPSRSFGFAPETS